MKCKCGKKRYAKGLCLTCYNAKWRKANAAKVKAYARRWHKSNPKKQPAYYRKFYLANMKKVQSLNRIYRVKHPEVETAIKNRYRAKRKGNGGSYTREEWFTLKRTYRNRCVCCGKIESALKALGRVLVPDHVLPISRGGTSFITNIQPLCHGIGGCNNRKNAKHIDYRIKFKIGGTK